MSSMSMGGGMGGGDPLASLGFGDIMSGGAGDLLSKMGMGDMLKVLMVFLSDGIFDHGS